MRKITTTWTGRTAILLHLDRETLLFPDIQQAEKVILCRQSGSLVIERQNVELPDGTCGIEYAITGVLAPHITLRELLFTYAFNLGQTASPDFPRTLPNLESAR